MAVKASQLVPGRCYSFEYVAPVEMVQTRDFGMPMAGTRDNPLFDVLVSTRRVVRVQAAGEATYARMKLAKDPNWKPSNRASWNHTSPKNDCIKVHNRTGEEYLRGIPRGIIKEEYFIGGKPASATEVETIRAFKKNQSEPDYLLFKLDNIENLIDDIS